MKSSQDYSSLDYHHDYLCPVCRRGRINTLALMETFACNLCQHLFKADLKTQRLTLIDGQLPITWQWYRQGWTRINPEGITFSWSYLFLGLLLVILPTMIVGCATYLFPPLPGSNLAWLPIAWTILTFLTHLFGLVWLLLEYYQFPVRLYIRSFFTNSIGS